MKPARIMLLAVAVIAGGLAAFLATRGGSDVQVAQTGPILEPSISVLVANQSIGVGQRLNSALVEWQRWPESALRPEYVTKQNMPDAVEQLVGTVARFEIFPGEPVRESKLVRADQGYLSAVLAKGMRGVSLPVAAASSAGGFIVPNDRVDVVQTITQASGVRSSTILQNVKVLAIGVRLGETGTTGTAEETENPQTGVFQGSTIATLELSPIQAETIIGAGQDGTLSLVLRSLSDFSEEITGPTAGQTVRMIRFGIASEAQGNGAPMASSDQGQPSAISTNFAPQTQPVFARAEPSVELVQ
jgi:pilus assembly protein CpaB